MLLVITIKRAYPNANKPALSSLLAEVLCVWNYLMAVIFPLFCQVNCSGKLTANIPVLNWEKRTDACGGVQRPKMRIVLHLFLTACCFGCFGSLLRKINL